MNNREKYLNFVVFYHFLASSGFFMKLPEDPKKLKILKDNRTHWVDSRQKSGGLLEREQVGLRHSLDKTVQLILPVERE